MRSTKSKAQ
jgi:bifunctional polynucleotide phosphatase/kinase